MITAALSAIFKCYPSAKVDVISGVDGKRVLKNYHPNLNFIYIYDRKDWLAFLKKKQLASEIEKNQYDLVFNFELNPSFQKFYNHTDAKSYELDRSEPELHYSQRCLNVVVRALGHDIAHEWAWLPVTEEARKKAQNLLKDSDITEDTFVIGIHPSFSGLKKASFRDKSQNYLREWSAGNFARTAVMLNEYIISNKLDCKIIMDLLPEERELGERIVKESNGAVILFTPEPDFERYKAMIERMDLLLVPNTGPMHIAAAVNTPIVALFSGLKVEDCGPFMPAEKFIALKSEDCSQPELGISAITPEQVFSACKPFLPQTNKA
ncbi:MAG: glycosyltransferase family 9 protein [Gammaproteobacteria bacterium]|nr:glycosyltransferase family 9 protein [Gammaproteobacteria bacterium]